MAGNLSGGQPCQSPRSPLACFRNERGKQDSGPTRRFPVRRVTEGGWQPLPAQPDRRPSEVGGRDRGEGQQPPARAPGRAPPLRGTTATTISGLNSRFIVLTPPLGSSDLTRNHPVRTRTHCRPRGPPPRLGTPGPRPRPRSALPPTHPPAVSPTPRHRARAPGEAPWVPEARRPGRARRTRGGARPQLRAGSPAARSHQEAVGALPRPLGAVGGLRALDLDVDRGGARFAGGGGGGAGRQGHVLGAAAGRGRVLAAQGAADGLRRVPQQVGDAAAAPAGLAPGRLGVLSVETTGGRVSGLLRARRGHGLAGAGAAGSLSAPRRPPPAPRLSLGLRLLSSASSWPATPRRTRGRSASVRQPPAGSPTGAPRPLPTWAPVPETGREARRPGRSRLPCPSLSLANTSLALAFSSPHLCPSTSFSTSASFPRALQSLALLGLFYFYF